MTHTTDDDFTDKLNHRAGRAETVVEPSETPTRYDYTYLGDVSTLVRHPHDDGVWLGAAGALDILPDEIDAVVSLCRVGTQTVVELVEAGVRHHLQVRLIDKDDPAENPDLDVVLLDTVHAIAALRAEGHTVLLHCAQAQSRTPSVAALYAALYRGVPIDRALAEVIAVLPVANPKRFLRGAVLRLGATVVEPPRWSSPPGGRAAPVVEPPRWSSRPGGRACRDPPRPWFRQAQPPTDAAPHLNTIAKETTP